MQFFRPRLQLMNPERLLMQLFLINHTKLLTSTLPFINNNVEILISSSNQFSLSRLKAQLLDFAQT